MLRIALAFIVLNLLTELIFFLRSTPEQKAQLRRLYEFSPVSYMLLAVFTSAPTYAAGTIWKVLT